MNVVNEYPTRFITLFYTTGMMDRFLFDPSEFERKKNWLFDDIDWTNANNALQKKINYSLSWLKQALEKQVHHSSDYDELLNSIIYDSEIKSLDSNIRCYFIEENLKENNINDIKKYFNDIQSKLEKYNYYITLLNNKNSIILHYWIYRILKNFTFKKKYTLKFQEYKRKIQEIHKI